ncbi:MAG: MmgE/PrpD family protein [Gammaproteobacteria bacterium]|nr:MmgE/PrpD family protein [Gammaproteobacteria bacterium]
MNLSPMQFIHEIGPKDIPDSVLDSARRSLIDLLGVAAAGTRTRLSSTIRAHALNHFAAAASSSRLLFDGRSCSAPGAALAGGMQIDSVDAHDGHKLTKGHAGCGVLPALLALCDTADPTAESEFLTSLVLGYEIAVRCGIALHRTVPDYHTSGAWVALAAAALGARHLGLDQAQSREAVGIAEYHGPRSQMMRCIDHPTMLKDGSGWGAMSGVSAALLAADGFTGAPALTVESDEVADVWCDLGDRWMMTEQYMKPYPVCRWAQPAIIAALGLREQHGFAHTDIEAVTIGTFHESKRLAVAAPLTTEQAQYSLPFPVACALVHGELGVEHIDGDGLTDNQVVTLSQSISLKEVDAYNQAFPARRISDVTIRLKDGRELQSGATEAAGDPETPLTEQQLRDKFYRLVNPVLAEDRAQALYTCVMTLGDQSDLQKIGDLIFPPVEFDIADIPVRNVGSGA